MANAYRSVLQDAKPTGNALPADVLAGKTFSNADGVDKTGTMVNNGAVTITLTDQDPSYTVPQGYHNGSGTVSFTPSGGDGADLVVTCSDNFAGSTISCTDGTTTFTEICPSTSPYVVTFESIPTGTWTVSGVVEGTTYSQQVVITDFDLTLAAGFYYKQWVTLGGLDPTDFTSLSEVFADEAAVRRLMSIHASADYLIEKVTDDIDTIDDFTANDTAMKWIGLRDYVCDGLTAIAGVEAKLMASQYWERYLKDHVPVMTSNTAPYGSVVPTSNNTTYPAWKMFDGDDTTIGAMASSSVSADNTTRVYYLFTNPICIKKCLIIPNMNCTGKIQYSDDGSTWIDATDIESISGFQSNEISINHDGYHLYWAFFANSWQQASVRNLNKIQFYGRALNVSVPVMTSNTAPYGQIFASSYIDNNRQPYHAFDGVLSSGTGSTNVWHSQSGFPQFVGYKSGSPYCVKYVRLRTSSYHYGLKTAKLQGSNNSSNGADGTWVDIGDFVDCPATGKWYFKQYDSNDNDYIWHRLYITESNYQTYAVVDELQFYGVDYSEREFAERSTMKYLYDHGVELETIDITGTVTKDDDYITLSAANAQASHTLDLTPYDLLRGKVGDHMSGTIALIAGTTATANMTAANAPNNNSLDVSSVNQSLATGSKMTSAGICDITELWLE